MRRSVALQLKLRQLSATSFHSTRSHCPNRRPPLPALHSSFPSPMAFNRVLEYLPSPSDISKVQLPRLPSWPAANSEREPSAPDDEPSTEPPQDDYDGPIILTEPKPIESGPKSNIDLVKECDNFPYYHLDPKLYLAHVNLYYGLFVKEHPNTELGYVLPSVAAVFKGLQDWKVNDEERSLTLIAGSNEEERSRAVAATTMAMKETDHFRILRGWRNELYPVYGPNRELLFNIERAASALFGIVTYGCHMTAYTYVKGEGDEKEMKIWVPRRAKNKQTYGGMLDNTVAGGIATGESAFESLVREAQEEASLPEDIVRQNAKAVGTVTYYHIRDQRAGGETRLLQPECQYVYDLELAEEIVPKPSDDEVEGFELMNRDEIKQALKDGEFKPNCALVLLDFFVRHGVLTAEEPGYIEIVARLHRRLEFPTL
jgi:8-oxo-dGTP pyrophosphatase MutT (NUDIX family)